MTQKTPFEDPILEQMMRVAEEATSEQARLAREFRQRKDHDQDEEEPKTE